MCIRTFVNVLKGANDEVFCEHYCDLLIHLQLVLCKRLFYNPMIVVCGWA